MTTADDHEQRAARWSEQLRLQKEQREQDRQDAMRAVHADVHYTETDIAQREQRMAELKRQIAEMQGGEPVEPPPADVTPVDLDNLD